MRVKLITVNTQSGEHELCPPSAAPVGDVVEQIQKVYQDWTSLVVVIVRKEDEN